MAKYAVEIIPMVDVTIGGSALQRHVRMSSAQNVCLAYAQIRPYLTD